MRHTKRVVQTASMAAGVIGGIAASAPETPLGRAAGQLADRLTRDVRYAASQAPGLVYRLAGRKPDPDVSDDILADRIRSTIGPLEKRLGVPRLHVMVEDHVAIVHGEVPNPRDASALEHTIMRVSGVEGVESHMHAGFFPGSARPPQGSATSLPPSEALRTLLDAASGAGASGDPRAAVHAVLCAFIDRVPEGERAHVLAHLPADVRNLTGPVHHGMRVPRVKTLPQLVVAVSAEGGVSPQHADDITRAVVMALRTLIPQEQRDIAAVLPAGLREFWETEPAG